MNSPKFRSTSKFESLLSTPSTSSEDNISSDGFTFLGKGSDASVDPGVVLIAPSHEYNHFLMKSAIFIYDRGLNDFDELVTRGVILDHPTAFTMAEMCDIELGSLGNQHLWRGGDAGNDTVMFIHAYGNQVNSSSEMIGNSGLYEGGLQEVKSRIESNEIKPDRCKFFFNYIEFRENELQGLKAELDSDGDAWAAMKVPSTFVTDSKYGRGEAWRYLRNHMKQLGYL